MAVETVKDQSVNNGRTNQAAGYLIVLMLVAAASLTGILIKERENRTFLRIIASPVTAKNVCRLQYLGESCGNVRPDRGSPGGSGWFV